MNRQFSCIARLFVGTALSIAITLALSGCYGDNAKESDSSADAELVKVMGVKDKQISPAGNDKEDAERLNMQIVEPDFDRNMGEPEISLEKRKGSALDF